MAKRTHHIQNSSAELQIESMDDQGRGVARAGGKVVFVSGALPGEHVIARYTRSRGRYDEAITDTVITPHADRTTPACEHFEVCGGCVLQHLAADAQIALKQQRLLDNLKRIGHVIPEQTVLPLSGDAWGYRARARLGVKHSSGKGTVEIGFRERLGHRIADIRTCDVMDPRAGKQINTIRDGVSRLRARKRVPQIEVLVDEQAITGKLHGILVVRHLDPLCDADAAVLDALGQELNFGIYLQPAGSESIHPLNAEQQWSLGYTLSEQNIRIQYGPADFTQVNTSLNQKMVTQALAWLAPQDLKSVLDLFCGIGNFTLPIARYCGQVLGVEGARAAVEQARANARHNALDHCEFEVADLNDSNVCASLLARGHEGLLLDPPRAGAAALINAMKKKLPRRIVYVSCSPASLARDLDGLVNRLGYRLVRVGVIDMFPHTSHVESMALLVRD